MFRLAHSTKFITQTLLHNQCYASYICDIWQLLNNASYADGGTRNLLQPDGKDNKGNRCLLGPSVERVVRRGVEEQECVRERESERDSE